MDDSHPRSMRKTIAGPALAGFASGILSIICLEVLSNTALLKEFRLMLYVPGVVFGMMISVYYAMFLRIRSWAKLLLFVAASIGAYFLAVQTTMYVIIESRQWLSRAWVFYGAMFLGSMVGAFVILAASQVLLSKRRKWKSILSTAILWSLAGGALGVTGWALGGSVGKVLWLALHAIRLTFADADLQSAVSEQTVNLFSLFVLWQACMAPVLGFLISKSARAEPQSAASSA